MSEKIVQKKKETLFHDEPTVGENDLLVLVIKFSPKRAISSGCDSLETGVWCGSRSRYLPAPGLPTDKRQMQMY